MESVYDLHKKAEELEGRGVVLFATSMLMTQYTFEQNYSNFIAKVRDFEEGRVEFFDPLQMNIHRRELLRLLHNYLSSGYTLVSIRREFIEKSGKRRFIHRFNQEEKKVILNSELVVFVAKLRNYVQHFSFPVSSARFKPLSLEPRLLSLERDAMIGWEGWWKKDPNQDSNENNINFLPLKFLTAQKSDINLKTLITDYHRVIRRFYLWFHSELAEAFESEWNEYFDVVRKIWAREGTVPPFAVTSISVGYELLAAKCPRCTFDAPTRYHFLREELTWFCSRCGDEGKCFLSRDDYSDLTGSRIPSIDLANAKIS